MARTIEGNLSAAGRRFGRIVGRFNDFVSERLLSGATDALLRSGAEADKIDVVRVPGSFEIPLAAKRMAASGRYDALIALGAVIRGATPHFDYVCRAVTDGVREVIRDTGVPVAVGGLAT